MGKTKKWLTGLSALAAVLALALVWALWAGQRPATGACVGDLPTGAFAAYRVQAADGNCLQGYVWRGEAPPRAVLVVVHGLADHARRYEGLAAALNQVGIAVVAQDLRGHGGSGGAAQRLDSVAQLLGDLALARQQAKGLGNTWPVFLYGHSLGGMVAAHAIAGSAQDWQAAVLSSAALKLPAGVSAGQIRVVSAVSALAPNLALEAIDPNSLVRSPQALQAFADDALLHRAKLPARTVATLLQGIDALPATWPGHATPHLLLHGGQDTVTDPEGSSGVHARSAAAAKQLKIYPDARHDLLHEPEARDVAQTIAGFLRSQLAAAQ